MKIKDFIKILKDLEDRVRNLEIGRQGGGDSSPLTTKGDLYTYSTENARLPVGTDGQILKSDSGETEGLNWVDNPNTLEVVIDGQGGEIEDGTFVCARIPFARSITKYTVLGETVSGSGTGSIQVDLWKDTYANYPPTDGDSIVASAPIEISSAVKNEDSTLTGWTKTITAGDVLKFYVDSCTDLTKVTIILELE